MVTIDNDGLLVYVTMKLVNVSSVFDAKIKVFDWAASVACSKA